MPMTDRGLPRPHVTDSVNKSYENREVPARRRRSQEKHFFHKFFFSICKTHQFEHFNFPTNNFSGKYQMNNTSSKDISKKDFHCALIGLYGTENTGVRYLSANLQREGYGVSTIFFREWRNNDNREPDEKEIQILIDLLNELKPQLVGLSFISSFVRIARNLTKRIKEETGIPVLWGGIHATTAPEECLEDADFVCLGEGEGPLLDLVKSLAEGKTGENIENIWLKIDGEIQKTPSRMLIQDLDTLPIPDYSEENKYLIDSCKLIKGEPLLAGAEYRIYASRGCPYACSYCYNSILRRIYKGKGKYYRFRSPEHVIRELEYAKKTFPKVRRIKVDDDTAFAFGKEWVLKFCELYKEKINIPFECLIHPHLLKEDLLWMLKDAGLIKVQIGIESASESEMNDVFKRAPGNKQIMEFAELNKKLKIEVVYDVIIDNPLATEKDKRALFDFLMELPGPYKLYLYSLVIFPGTELAREMLEKGLITEDDIEGKNTKAWIQFRVSMDYPRSKEDVYWLSLILLVSKNFVPRNLVKWASEKEYFRKNPGLLFFFSKMCNLVRMAQIGFEMLFNGELTFFKLRQYGSFSKLISQ